MVAAVVVVVVVFVIVVVADADAVDVDVVFVIIVFLSCLLFSCSYGCRTSNPKIVGSSPAKDWPHTRVGGSSRRLLNNNSACLCVKTRVQPTDSKQDGNNKERHREQQ